jgi:hypothetical protein
MSLLSPVVRGGVCLVYYDLSLVNASDDRNETTGKGCKNT